MRARLVAAPLSIALSAVVLAHPADVGAATTNDVTIRREAVKGYNTMDRESRRLVAAAKALALAPGGDGFTQASRYHTIAVRISTEMQLARASIQLARPSSAKGRTAKAILIQAFGAWTSWADLSAEWTTAVLDGHGGDASQSTLSDRSGEKWNIGYALYKRAMKLLPKH